MINGMTGFGSAQFSDGKVRGVVEIKSLNHRYLDINYYLPIGFGSLEDKIKQVLGKHIARGRVSVSIKITERPGTVYKFNKAAARQYLKDAESLSQGLGLRNDLSLSDIVRLPGVVDSNEEVVSAESVWPLLEKNIQRAVKGLADMR